MTEATVADLKTLFDAGVSLQTYSDLRDVALANEGNAREFEEMANAISDSAGPEQLTNKGVAFWRSGVEGGVQE